jgi:phage terminase small subunit
MQRRVILPLGYNRDENGDKFIPLPELILPEKERTKRLRKGELGVVKPACRKMGRKLNEDELREKFCHLYATRGDLSAKDCVYMAGYSSVNTAYRLLKDPAILARIEEIKGSGIPCIVRATLAERKKLYLEKFLRLYNEKKVELHKGLGAEYRIMQNRRKDKVGVTRREKKEGWTTEHLHHRDATEYAKAICDKEFGPVLLLEKTKFNKYRKDHFKWQYPYKNGAIRW